MNKELGDFQTPPSLVNAVLACLYQTGKVWTRVVEPTCGQGNFIEGLLQLANPPSEIQAIELQDMYVKSAQKIAEQSPTCVVIKEANLFDLDLHKDLQWRETGPLLVIGNPPWVTNSELGTLASTNLPIKKNIKGLRGIEARTGKSNFDIAEYIWLKIMQELALEHPTIALLCKTSVARNVLQFAFDANLPITQASIHMIDAKKWFGAAVEACLFRVELGQSGEQLYEAAVYPDLCAVEPAFTTGIVGKQLVADVQVYKRTAAADGVCPITWRQGLKHDAASIMELIYHTSDKLSNKLGEHVIVEPDYLYPLLKSSDMFHGVTNTPPRAVIVTQKRLGEDTCLLRQVAPQLWSYLTAHTDIFERRKSSIYENQSPFAIFGIGDYSFSPYKVGISGFHKTPRFRAIGPVNGRPVMLDDTCYFIPCYTPMQAAFLTSLLNDPVCLQLINSIVFLDAKRPITKKLLQRIDLKSLFQLIERQSFISRANGELARLRARLDQQEVVWPSMEEFLDEYFQHASCTSPMQDKTGTTRQLTWIV